jgi:hypothetical protein
VRSPTGVARWDFLLWGHLWDEALELFSRVAYRWPPLAPPSVTLVASLNFPAACSCPALPAGSAPLSFLCPVNITTNTSGPAELIPRRRSQPIPSTSKLKYEAPDSLPGRVGAICNRGEQYAGCEDRVGQSAGQKGPAESWLQF